MPTVFIGDIQGCVSELDRLLQEIDREIGDVDEVLLVGDLVNRGPDSLGVLQFLEPRVARGRVRSVMGNHEVGLLMAGLGLRAVSPRDTIAPILEAPDAEVWLDWVRRLPLAIPGQLGGRPFALVHAAVAPEWSLETLLERAAAAEARLRAGDLGDLRDFLALAAADDPDRDVLDRLTRCRGVDPAGGWSSAEPEHKRDAWHRRWREHDHDYGVVYGHWATQGLHVEAGLRGLDTGCVHHGRGHDGFLTAWIPDETAADPFGVPDGGRLFQVKAARPYYREILERESGVDLS